MAFFKLKLSLFFLVLYVVQGKASSDCDTTAEKYLLEDLNLYRMSLISPNFTENNNAACLANNIASQLKNKTCKNTFHYSFTPGTKPNVTEYDKLMDGCDIKENHTIQGVILPVFVPKLDPFLVLFNYNTPQYAKYLKDSNYTDTRIGSEDNWMVVVLSTNTLAGFFFGAASLIANHKRKVLFLPIHYILLS
ncbi:hypothetical protein ACB092_12G208400 [Castanea dentata]